MLNLAGEYLQLHCLRLTGNPLVLTINGKAALVVQDVHSHQKLCDQASGSSVKPVKRGQNIDG
jgi:hypothetical protein